MAGEGRSRLNELRCFESLIHDLYFAWTPLFAPLGKCCPFSLRYAGRIREKPGKPEIGEQVFHVHMFIAQSF